MADANYNQTQFLGGEWGPLVQGRTDLPDYRKAMNACLNAYPIEEGACPRRPGFAHAAFTRGGAAGRLISFDFLATNPYNIELTSGHMRFFDGLELATTNDAGTVSSISTANPAEVTVSAMNTWATGDHVFFSFSSAVPASFCPLLRNRRFTITVIDNEHFTLADELTGANIDGSTIGWTTQTGVTVNRVLDIVTPWTGTEWNTQSLRMVQVDSDNQEVGVFLNSATAPQALLVDTAPTNSAFATFSLEGLNFEDGPYLDPVAGVEVEIIGGGSSSDDVLCVSWNYPTWSSSIYYPTGATVYYNGTDYVALQSSLNNEPDTSPTNWQSIGTGSAMGVAGGIPIGDSGTRLVRIFLEPPAWASGTTYAAAANVFYNGNYYQSLAGSNVGNEPDISPTKWQLNPSAAFWIWGTYEFQSDAAPNAALVLLSTPLTSAQLTAYSGYVFPSSLAPIGVYSATAGYPTCGAYHEGRLWLGGVVPNRIDGSVSNGLTGSTVSFSPTGPDGTVAEDDAVSVTFNSTDMNPTYWLVSTLQGLVCGTKNEEWLVQPGSSGPIAADNIQIHRVTKYGSENIEPRITGLTFVFVQRFARKLLEYFADVFSGRFSAPNLSWPAKHLTQPGIAEIAYQRELAPIVWSRCNDGSLIGTTYKRESLFSSQGPTFAGWHRHSLGSNQSVESICVGPNVGGNLDSLAIVAQNTSSGIYDVQVATDLFDFTQTATTGAWFVDNGIVPSGGVVGASGTENGVTFNGLWHLNGNTVSAFICGLDCGDFAVSNGSMFVPFQSDNDGLFTLAYMEQLSAAGGFGNFACPVDLAAGITTGRLTIPAVIGFTYTTQGQILRPGIPQDAGSMNGPPAGKVRRSHQYTALIQNGVSQTISFGTGFASPYKMHAPIFKTAGNTPYMSNELYSGVFWDNLDDQYTFDSMLAWQITRPVPGTICSIGGFLGTQDR